MSAIDDSTRLQHMHDAAVEALDFIADCDRDDLDSDRRLTLALVKEIEIIGEAASRVSQSCQNRHPHMPWSDIIGMRNRLVHACFDIDLDIVWEVVTHDLPLLLAELKLIISLEVNDYEND